MKISEATRQTPSANVPAVAARPRGRPLSFDRDAVLELAMHVFWERGYEAASVADLTSAMGITPPSLYTAFGDKERLFLEAIDRYLSGPGGLGLCAFEQEATARGAIERWLQASADGLTQSCHPKGCMVMLSAMNCSAAAEHVRAALGKRRGALLARVRARIQDGIDASELAPETDAKALANFYVAVFQGMSMQARDGASRANLTATVDTAMRAWPAKRRRSAPR